MDYTSSAPITTLPIDPTLANYNDPNPALPIDLAPGNVGFKCIGCKQIFLYTQSSSDNGHCYKCGLFVRDRASFYKQFPNYVLRINPNSSVLTWHNVPQ